MFSPASAGFYAVASRVMMIPSILIGDSVRQVYYQKVSDLTNQKKSILNTYTKTTLSLFLMALLPISVIIIWGESLFRIIFGPGWGEAGMYASLLSIWILFSFMNPPSTVTILILGLNRLQLLLETLLLILRILSIWAGYYFYNDIIISILFFSAVGGLYQISFMFFIYTRLRNS
jgi:O-antigen/teichoic acid export membrane protein